MIHKILNWFRRGGLESRGFFCFLDRGKLRAVDPLRIARELLNPPQGESFNLDSHLPFLMLNQEPETTNGINMICRIFGLVRWSESTQSGWSDAELIGLLFAFHAFMEAQKKTTDNGPKILSAGDGRSSTGGQTPPNVTESSPLEYGSIRIEPTTGSHGGPCAGCGPVSTGPAVAS